MRHLLERFGGFLPSVIALALPTVFFTGTIDSFILPRASIVIAGACLGTGIALLVPDEPRLGALRWPLLAATGAAVLAFLFSVSWPLSLAGSYTRYESLPMRLSYVGLLVSTAWLLRTQRQRDWVVAAFVFGTAVACLEAIQQGGLGTRPAPFRPDGNLGNANLLAGMVAMGVPLALDRALRAGWFSAAWAAAAVVMVVGGLVMTSSRSGGLGVLAGCLTFAAFAIRRRQVATVVGVAGAGVMAVAVAFLAFGPLRALNDDPSTLRTHLWQDGLRMLAGRPFTGWGEDTTGLVFGHFLSRDYATMVTFDRVHSGPLDTGAMVGLVGLASIAWVLVMLFLTGWRHRLEGNVAALAGALAGYSVWVFFNFDWAPVTGVFWLLAGTLLSAPPHSWGGGGEAAGGAARREKPQFWQPALAVMLVVAAIVFAVLPLLADVWYLHSRLDLSVRVDPYQAQYHWALGDYLVGKGDLPGGVSELRRAADLGETEPGLYLDLGNRELQLKNLAQARRDYQRALEIDPYFSPAAERLAALGG